MVVDSPQYKSLVGGQMGTQGLASVSLPGMWTGDLDRKTALIHGDAYAESEYKAVMTEAAGFAPYTPRISDVVPFALRRPMVQDLMPSVRISTYSIQYMEETTATQVAAPVAEGGSKPQATYVYTPRTANAEVIACYLPVTEQQISDVPFLMDYINRSLGLQVALAEEAALLTGNGSSPQIQGYTTKSGINTQAAGSDPIEVGIMKNFTQIRAVGFAEPDAVVMHPTDWQTVVTHQLTTGAFLYGSPQDTVAKRMWGVPTVVTPAISQGTALSGDFATYSYMIRRLDLRIDVGYVNDDFIRNQKSIRAEARAGLIIRRAAAYATLTGISSSN
jgi:HK97 family phage major capsid protein